MQCLHVSRAHTKPKYQIVVKPTLLLAWGFVLCSCRTSAGVAAALPQRQAVIASTAARYSTSCGAAASLTTPRQQQTLPQAAAGPTRLAWSMAHWALPQIPKAPTQPSLASTAGYGFGRCRALAAAAPSSSACRSTTQGSCAAVVSGPTQPPSSLLLSPTTSSSTPSHALEGHTGSHVVHSLPAVAAVMNVCRAGTASSPGDFQQQERVSSS